MHIPYDEPEESRYPGAGWKAYALVLFATIILGLPRFGHTTPDSIYYIELVEYFRGRLPLSELHSPFAFRWALPWLAAWVPGGSPAMALTLCSLATTVVAYGLFGRLLLHLGVAGRAWRFGMATLVLSFPTVNYGTAVLTDSAGFLVLCAAAWALLERRHTLLGIVLVAGVCVRESSLVILPALWLFFALERDRKGLVIALCLSLVTLLSVSATRWYFAELPAYFWAPSWGRFTANIARPVSWATVLLTLAPVGLLAMAGAPQFRGLPRRSRNFLIAFGVPLLALAIYGALAAFMSGRFCWPLYLVLVPLAALARPNFTTSRTQATGGVR